MTTVKLDTGKLFEVDLTYNVDGGKLNLESTLSAKVGAAIKDWYSVDLALLMVKSDQDISTWGEWSFGDMPNEVDWFETIFFASSTKNYKTL